MNPANNAIKLSKGANAPLNVNSLTVSLTWKSNAGAPDVDISSLILQENGKVSSDEDFIFYNQPSHFSGALKHTGKSTIHNGFEDSLKVDLNSLNDNVDKIIIAGSADGGSFGSVPDLLLTVFDSNSSEPLIEFNISDANRETAFIFGEIYRRNGVWKFRAVGQGYDSGLAGLATDFGISVEDDEEETLTNVAPTNSMSVAPPPSNNGANVKPDWYPENTNSDTLRWWDGSSWSNETIPKVWPGNDACSRCGTLPKRKMFQRNEPGCKVCDAQIDSFMRTWQSKAHSVLETEGPGSLEWDELWVSLRHARIDKSAGLSAVRIPALSYLERYVAFAFADGEIEEDEMLAFQTAIKAIGIEDRSIDLLKKRMDKGRLLTKVRSGELPLITSNSLQLDSDELLHLDETITHIKVMASGPKKVPGRFIATNKKLRFVAPTGGWELAWAKIISAESEYDRLVLSTTAAKGGGEYEVENSEQVAAILVGIMRVAKRLVLAPGQRDTRSIPQAMRTAVWQRDGGKCVECQAAEYLEFDHVIPHSKGGATSISNLQLLCRKCNQSKGARI